MIGYVCMCRDQDDDDDDDNHNDAHSTSRRWRRETKKINAWVVDGRHARRGRRRRGKSVAGKALRGNASKAASEACNNIRNVHSATNDKNINEIQNSDIYKYMMNNNYKLINWNHDDLLFITLDYKNLINEE